MDMDLTKAMAPLRRRLQMAPPLPHPNSRQCHIHLLQEMHTCVHRLAPGVSKNHLLTGIGVCVKEREVDDCGAIAGSRTEKDVEYCRPRPDKVVDRKIRRHNELLQIHWYETLVDHVQHCRRHAH